MARTETEADVVYLIVGTKTQDNAPLIFKLYTPKHNSDMLPLHGILAVSNLYSHYQVSQNCHPNVSINNSRWSVIKFTKGCSASRCIISCSTRK
jgi:hypothetical protein